MFLWRKELQGLVIRKLMECMGTRIFGMRDFPIIRLRAVQWLRCLSLLFRPRSTTANRSACALHDVQKKVVWNDGYFQKPGSHQHAKRHAAAVPQESR